MRFATILVLFCSLVGCNRPNQNQSDVRQAVLDYLPSRGINLSSMDVSVTSIQFNGNQAEATVAFTVKGGSAATGMTMRYQLQQDGGKWKVTGRKDSGANAHGATVAPDAASPHGGGMPAHGAGGGPGAAMPAPEDLPPAHGTK